MRRLLSFAAGLLSFLGGCNRSHVNDSDPGGATAVAVPTGDNSLEAATEEARANLGKFTGPLSHPGPGQSDFSVKVPVIAGGGTHYLWLQEVTFDGTNFSGILGPDAAGLAPHSPGERVTVSTDDIADWMYVADGRLVGGYSLRVIRDRLTGEARRRFEESMWFRFE